METIYKTEQDFDRALLDMHSHIVSTNFSELPKLSESSRSDLIRNLSDEQRAHFESISFDKVNLVVKMAKKFEPNEFVSFVKDPESFAIPLTPSEMEVLTGGGRLGSAIVGAASGVAVMFSLGLSSGGCIGAMMLHEAGEQAGWY